MKILGIGNALVDVLVRLDDDRLLNELQLQRGGMSLIDLTQERQMTTLMNSMHPELATGGSASNVILSLAKMGAEVGFIGRVGDDGMGHFYMNHCRERGIETRMSIGQGMTGVANTLISPDGERTFATFLGEASKLSAADITEDMLEGYDLIHIEGYLVQNHELIERVTKLAKARGMKVSLDLASYNVVEADRAFFRHLITDYVDIVFANEEESAAFTQGKEPHEALLEIAPLCNIAVVKLGKRGASGIQMSVSDTIFYSPGSTESVVDTTAAGDFFAGGFLLGYSRGLDLQQCLNLGAQLSQEVIKVIGTQVAEETWERLKKTNH